MHYTPAPNDGCLSEDQCFLQKQAPNAMWVDIHVQGVKSEFERVEAAKKGLKEKLRITEQHAMDGDDSDAEEEAPVQNQKKQKKKKQKKTDTFTQRPDNVAIHVLQVKKERVNTVERAGHVPGIDLNHRYVQGPNLSSPKVPIPVSILL